MIESVKILSEYSMKVSDIELLKQLKQLKYTFEE